MIERSLDSPANVRIQRTRVPIPRLRGVVRLIRVSQYRDEIEVSIPLCVIQAISDHEAIRDLESHVTDRQVDPAPVRLGQQRAHLYRRRIPRVEAPEQV